VAASNPFLTPYPAAPPTAPKAAALLAATKAGIRAARAKTPPRWIEWVLLGLAARRRRRRFGFGMMTRKR